MKVDHRSMKWQRIRIGRSTRSSILLRRWVILYKTSIIYKKESCFLNYQSWRTMTKESSDNESASPKKLLIDKPSDFQFHAAFLAYSEAFENAKDPEIREKLNHNITALQKNQIDYQTFYGALSQYREVSTRHRNSRVHIKTQRKREWRRNTQRRERNKRYRK